MVPKFILRCSRFTRGLRFKLSFYTGLVVFLSIVVFAYHSISVQERNLVQTRIQSAMRNSEVIKAAIWNGMMVKERRIIREIVDTVGQQEGFEQINIYDRDGVLHYTSSSELKPEIGKRFPGGLSPLLKDLGVDRTVRYELQQNTNFLTVVNPLINTPSCSTAACHAHPASHDTLGALEVKLELKGLRRDLGQSARSIGLFAIFLFLMVSTFIGLGVIFLVTRPVERLRAKAQAIATGRYKPGQPATGVDSIAELSRSLDEMSRQINQREREVDQRRRMYQELFEKVPCYLLVVSRDYRIVRANEAFIGAFGDQVGQSCFSAFKGRDSQCPNCQVQRTFADGLNHRSDEVWNLKNSVEKAHVIITTTPIFDDRGEITEVLEMAVDVTRLVRLQEELKKKEEQFKNLFENIPCYLTVIDRSFRIGFYNKMFSADFGNRWGEPCYKAYKGRSEKCENCPVEKTFNDGYSHYSEEIWTINGSERHIIVRTAPVTDQSGGILAVMEMCSDVTELKMLENRLAILGETIAGTSHAIKNILSGLEGGVYVVDSGFRSQNEQRMTTGWVMVKKNVGMISELVKDILYASKDRKPELKAVDPGQVLGNLIELFDEKAGKEGIRLVKAFDDKMGEALLDPQGIHTLLSNLITNAMAACAENRGASAPQIILSARVEDALLIIEVADTGPGMSEDVKDNLFKKFYSTKGAKGTGLGLLVSRKIVDENGGTITCESELGRGTKFIVRLPFKKPGQETAERSVEVN